MSRNIICVVEFDNYPEQVVDRAFWLFKTRDCKLHLLIFYLFYPWISLNFDLLVQQY